MCGSILPQTVLAQYPFVFDLKHFVISIPFQVTEPFQKTILDIVECILYSLLGTSFNYTRSEMWLSADTKGKMLCAVVQNNERGLKNGIRKNPLFIIY
jgi:hypothetical protein